ncbi:2-dehydropantoate 2-reductase [Vulcanimicrobium alpinum]|uniref:2-dehydropantoate 2-reductase n=1 Tax=Vulcanimicrobium alpinum TaxID=3016050 RepID=A0AAN2C8S9_UNVUL|nr:ketopantoate reductase C-terminal domain-containing protein [Vulcanimicrobium alpinum]BDE05276.1 2-dehydropantoate 2-reductase [Vulcanimicrobium alpinum]
MHVYVVGKGAVGTYLGELLRGIGNDVTYAPRALEDIVPVDADLAVVAVKSYDTPGAIATLQRALRDPGATTILTAQNGIGNEEALAAAFGADNVVAAALTVPVEIDAAGKGVAAKGGGIAFAPVGTASPNNWLLAAFGATGLPTTAVRDYRSLKWSKLALNLVANATCAILDVLPERLVREDEVFALEIRAIREVRQTMKALGIAPIDLPRYPVRALLAVATMPTPMARAVLAGRIATARGEKPPSLLLDLRSAKHRTEVDVLNGAVARAARDAGIEAPVNTAIARILNDVTHMPQLWAKYRERPAALVSEIKAESGRAPSAANEIAAAADRRRA